MSFLSGLFKSQPSKSGIIFIVEDNPTYAKTIQAFIRSKFPEIKEVKMFPVGETCLMDIQRDPDIVIMDYFLDSKYSDAENGLEIVKAIRAQKPETNIIVLSSQQEVGVVLESVKTYGCSYIKKDDLALSRLEEIIRKVYS